jgi:hypothetical protein
MCYEWASVAGQEGRLLGRGETEQGGSCGGVAGGVAASLSQLDVAKKAEESSQVGRGARAPVKTLDSLFGW